jgi:Ca2+-binding RTX toxin-like protein
MATINVVGTFEFDSREFFLNPFPPFYTAEPGVYVGIPGSIVRVSRGFGFTYAGDTQLTGGTVTSIRDTPVGGGGSPPELQGSITIAGLSVSAASLSNAIATATKGDDNAIIRAVLAGSDSFAGSTGEDYIHGFDGADTLKGNGGNDILYGDLRADSLLGGAGADALVGGAGNDRLIGGPGIDLLVGGPDNDSFIFNAAVSAANRDVIKDFAKVAGNDDSLLLENAVFAELAAVGPLNPAFFRAGPAALDGNDFIVYNRATGGLFYDFNGSAAGGAVQFALLQNKPLLQANDFVVI